MPVSVRKRRFQASIETEGGRNYFIFKIMNVRKRESNTPVKYKGEKGFFLKGLKIWL
jgi:hypothetical protein